MRVAVVIGGPSKEHEVSLSTGASILEYIDQSKYEPTKVLITKDSQWIFADDEPVDQAAAISKLKAEFDVVVLGLHGTFGEDGQIQKVFEENEIKYTGSDSKSSELAMNKYDSAKVFKEHGIRTPNTNLVTDVDKLIELAGVEAPVVVKPVKQGSSVGVSIVNHTSQLEEAAKEAFKHDDVIVVDEFIDGREVSCGVLETDEGHKSLPPTELIVKQGDFFDYDAKYKAGFTDEITPPDMPEEVIQKIQDLALEAHKALGCSGYSRTDMIIRESDKEFFVLETNTLPGMTKTSILPQQAEAAGISFAKLIDTIITSAIKE